MFSIDKLDSVWNDSDAPGVQEVANMLTRVRTATVLHRRAYIEQGGSNGCAGLCPKRLDTESSGVVHIPCRAVQHEIDERISAERGTSRTVSYSSNRRGQTVSVSDSK